MGLLALSVAFLNWPDVDGDLGDPGLGSGVSRHPVSLRPGLAPGDAPFDPIGSDPTATALGGKVDIPADAATVILAAPPGGRYAVRLMAGAGAGPWVELTHAPTETPDGAGDGDPLGWIEAERTPPGPGPGAEGWASRPRALPPLLVGPGDETVEVLAVGTDGAEVEAFFLTRDLTGTGGEGEGVSEGEDVSEDGPSPRVAGRVQTGPGGPAIVPRSGWTGNGWASDNGGCAGGPWYSDNLQAVVIHHTVTGNGYGRDDVDDLLRAIHYSHVEINGWCDIGYNFLVDRFGTVWEGRAGGVERPVIGGHAKGFNTATMGIALLGQHQSRARPASAAPTSDAEEAARALAQWKLGRHGIDPTGQTWLRNRSSRPPHRLTEGRWHLVPTILGHRHVGVTSCPGDLGLGVVDHLRQNLATPGLDRRVASFSDWQPHGHGPGVVVLDQGGRVRPAGSVSVAPGPGPDAGPIAPPSPGPVAIAGSADGAAATGWTLHADGMLHPFGGAVAVADRPAGDRTVVDLAQAEVGGWVVATDGTVHPFGGAPTLGPGPASRPVVAGAIDRAGAGYLLDDRGDLIPVGGVPAASLPPDAGPVIDLAVAPGGRGGWAVAADGRLWNFGTAPAAGLRDPSAVADRPVVAVVASASGQGGWVATADGALWPFGRERLLLPATTATASAVDAAFVGSHLPPSFLDGAQGRYLDAVSRLFRDRAGTPDEIERWEGWLVYGEGRLEVTLALAGSAEWYEGRVERLYRDVLGRAPDPGGRAYWTGRLAEGVPLAEVGSAFYGSSEYRRAAGSTDAYIDRLYRTLLGRPPDPGGRAYWVRELDEDRATPAQVTIGFYQSEEFRRQRVRDLYQEVLGRSPDPAGEAFWVQRLAQTTDGVVAAELATSDEFFRLAQQ